MIRCASFLILGLIVSSVPLYGADDGADPAPYSLTPAQAKAGWRVLFDGKSTDAWRGFKREGFPAKGWVVEKGALKVTAGGGGGDILTREKYGDFDLRLEWKVSKGANSGIMYKVDESRKTTWRSGPEYQIFDDQGRGTDPASVHSAGALYGLYPNPADKPVKPAGAWNKTRILIRGGHVEHWLNGMMLMECDLNGEDFIERWKKSKFASYPTFGRNAAGYIALQDHGNDVWFRNIRIRDLSAEGAEKSVSLFNGKDLSGWTCHLKDDGELADVWSVKDGIIICKGRPVGYLYTEKSYKNFILRLEWRFNPVTKIAGNSGVLLRQTGPHKVWPRSLEAQLQSGNAGDFWVIDGFPANVAADRTRGRNTKKTHFNEFFVGQWNEYEIHVKGGDVTLIVNGEVLNEATGAEIAEGPICLQSEGAEIHFRNIRITPLD